MSTPQLLLLTLRQVAVVLNLSEVRVRFLVERGEIPSAIIDGEIRVSNEALREHIGAGGITGSTAENSYKYVLKIAERERVLRAKGERRTAKRAVFLSVARDLANALLANVGDIDPDAERQRKVASTLNVCLARFDESIKEIRAIAQ